MKYSKTLSILFSLAFLVSAVTPVAFAKMSFDNSYPELLLNNNFDSLDERAAGRMNLLNLKSHKLECTDLSDDDFDEIGTYLLWKKNGNYQAVLNFKAFKTFGLDGKEQVHILFGKQQSGCDKSATLPEPYTKFSSVIPFLTESSWQ